MQKNIVFKNKVSQKQSLKFRIILSTIVCILIVGVFSNIYLYFYLNNIITEKADNIDKLNLQTVEIGLNQRLQEFAALGNVCSNDLDIARGIHNKQMVTVEEKRELLRAQEILRNYLSAFSIEKYISRLLIFNEEGVCVQAVTRKYSTLQDAALVMEKPSYARLIKEDQPYVVAIEPAIVDREDSLVYISKVFEYPSAVERGYLYMEMDPAWITDVLLPYEESSLFVAGSDRIPYPSGSGGLSDEFLSQTLGGDEYIDYEEHTYRIMSTPLLLAGLTLYSKTDATFLVNNKNPIFFTTIVVIITSFTAAVMLAVLLSNIITKPLKRLTSRLLKISDKNFEYDREIEDGYGELGQIGKIVNQMTTNITNLLEETEQMHIQQKNAEIALLQSQINPHFLYNTLDSIRWMAVIQKAPGIEKTVRSLSNLLKNTAKGLGDKIPLKEELNLLQDYVDTQSVRFMQMFELNNQINSCYHHYRIVKFTLQPLVENAIFHGIEPSGNCGVITLDAYEEGEYLIITVEDDGVGMTAQELEEVKKVFENPYPQGMSSIGVANVDHRLKLTYGKDCGVCFESEKGKYTKVTIKIRKEE